jgi:hypothetical protein
MKRGRESPPKERKGEVLKKKSLGFLKPGELSQQQVVNESIESERHGAKNTNDNADIMSENEESEQKTPAPPKAPTLSKGISNLKFMSRGKEAEIRQKLSEEREKSLREEKWVYDDHNSRVKYVVNSLLINPCTYE